MPAAKWGAVVVGVAAWAGGGRQTRPGFDGTSWSIHTVGVFDVYAAGQFWVAVPTSAVDPNPISFFDGTAATPVTIAGWQLPTEITSLWGRSADDVWGAGEDVAHDDGMAWTRASGTPDAACDVDHTHSESLVTGDATATWLVGRGPTFFRRAAAP